MELISYYLGKVDLKQRIIAAYVSQVKFAVKMKKGILADPGWASSGSEYHRRCRERMSKEIIEFEKQLKLLK